MVTKTALEAYRVTRPFQWQGWKFAPGGKCRCTCSREPQLGCAGLVGEGCNCANTTCHCDCGIDPKQYGGDIWLVAPGNPRKETMITQRFAVGDASLPPVEELLKLEEYQRLLKPWSKDLEFVSSSRRRAKA